MPGYDGEIKLGVSLEPKDIKRASSEISREVRSTFDGFSGKKVSTEVSKILSNLSKTEAKAKQLKNTMSDFETVPTSKMKELQSQFREQAKELSTVRKLMAENPNSSLFTTWEQQEKKMLSNLDLIKSEMDKLKQSGDAFGVSSENADAYEKVKEQLNDTNNARTLYIRQLEAQRQKEEQTGQSTATASARFKQLASAIGRVAVVGAQRLFGALENQLKRLLLPIQQVVDSLREMVSSKIRGGLARLGETFFGLRRSSADLNKTLKGAVKTFIKYAFGVRSFFFLWRKIRTAIKEGFGNLAQVSDPVNLAISDMISSLSQLKNSFAASFAPIATVVLPLLTAMINGITTAINAIGQLIAALTGKSTFTRAKKVQTDYAASLAGTAGSAGGAADALDDEAQSAKELEKQLMGFDDVNILTEKNEKAAKASGGGGAGGGGVADMFEEVPIDSAFKNFADKLKKAIADKDWQELGRLIAEPINKGIDWIYEKLDPEKIMPRVEAFTDAVAGTVNSVVDNIHWNKMGRAVGRGINVLVHAFNRLIDPETGIDFRNIGKKLAEGANGLVSEINWREIGNVIGNKMMILPRILGNFAKNFNWLELGQGIAAGINGFFEKWNLSEIMSGLTAFINGLFTALRGIVEDTDWGAIAVNIYEGINTFIREFDWKGNAKTLNDFIISLLDTLVEIVDNTDWEGLGQGIADALAQIDWVGILSRLAHIIVTALGGLLKGLMSNGEGIFAAGIIAAVAAFKVGSKLLPIGSAIANYFGKGPIYRSIANAIGGGAQAGAATASTSIGAMATSALGTIGIIAAAIMGVYAIITAIVDTVNGELQDGTGAIRTEINDLTDDIKKSSESWKKKVVSGIVTVEDARERLTEVTEQQTRAEGNLKAAQINNRVETEESAAREQVLTAIRNGNTAALTGQAKAIYDTAVARKAEDDAISATGATLEDYVSKIGTYNWATERSNENVEIAKQQQEELRTELTNATLAYLEAGVAEGEFTDKLQNQLSIIDLANPHYSDMRTLIQGLEESEYLTGEQAAEFNRILDEQRLAGIDAKDAFADLGIGLANYDMIQQEKLTNARAELDQWKSTIENSMQGASTSMQQLVQDSENSLASIVQNSEAQLEKQNEWYNLMIQAAEVGFGPEYLRVLQQLGPDSAQVVRDALALASSQGVQAAQIELGKVAQATGDMVSPTAKAYYDKMVSVGVDKISKSYNVSAKELKGDVEVIGDATTEGITSSLTNPKNLGQIETATTAQAKVIPSTYNSVLGINSPSKVMQSATDSVTDGIVSSLSSSQNKAKIRVAMNDLIASMKQPFTQLQTDMKSIASDIGETISKAFSRVDLSGAGYKAVQSFIRGYKSTRIPTPHFYVSEWNWQDLGEGGGFYMPTYAVSWYKRGGLFDTASIIGVGEAGTEAVLPIESPSVMSKLSSSIVSAMERLPAIARGNVVPYSATVDKEASTNKLRDAIAATQNINLEDLKEIIGQAVRENANFAFYMGDEEVARHANAGNVKLKSRFNLVR